MKKIMTLVICLLSVQAYSAVTRSEFSKLESALHKAFNEINTNANEVLAINPVIENMERDYWWNIDYNHASYVRQGDENKVIHAIYLMGGFARQSFMTLDGLALTACHEIGHGIGGAPKKEATRLTPIPSSTEGQSDYFATKVCLPVVFKYLKQTKKPRFNRSIENLCRRQVRYNLNLCKRMLSAVSVDIAWFRSYGEYVSFDRRSNYIEVELNTAPDYYPEAQCRLDTMVDGVLGKERPECWFPKN